MKLVLLRNDDVSGLSEVSQTLIDAPDYLMPLNIGLGLAVDQQLLSEPEAETLRSVLDPGRIHWTVYGVIRALSALKELVQESAQEWDIYVHEILVGVDMPRAILDALDQVEDLLKDVPKEQQVFTQAVAVAFLPTPMS
jgi:hypothetical protein